MDEEKKNSPVKEYFNNWKNIRKNFQTIRNNPYAFQKFQYYFIRLVLIVVACFLVFQIGSMIFSYSSGSKPMAMLGRAFMLLVLAVFLSKLWGMNKQMKKILLHYEQFPSQTIDDSFNEKKLDLKTEIDDILNKYDDNGNLK